jgi:hypothetical protein
MGSQMPTCPRDQTIGKRYSTFKFKFQQAGHDRQGNAYWQYHLHFNLRQWLYPYARRSWMRVTIRRPDGIVSNAPFNDSDTRRSRGASWKPWYAHTTIRIRPGSTMSYFAYSDINEAPLGGNRFLVSTGVHGTCMAQL